MRKTTIVSMFVAILFVAAAGCATLETAGHKYIMKGQILDVSDGQVYLCVGSAEGAKAGQEFLVYRHVRAPYAGKATPSFKREMVGSVKITQVVDEHFAMANILRGDIKVNDVAELAP